MQLGPEGRGRRRPCVGAWRNVVNGEPELAALVRARAPRLAEALAELDDLVMPKGVSSS